MASSGNRITPMANNMQPRLAGLDQNGVPVINDVAPPLIVPRSSSTQAQKGPSPRSSLTQTPRRKRSTNSAASQRRKFHSASRYTKARSKDHHETKETQNKTSASFQPGGFLGKLNKKYRYGKEAEVSFYTEEELRQLEPVPVPKHKETFLPKPSTPPDTQDVAEQTEEPDVRNAATEIVLKQSTQHTQSDWSKHVVNAQTQSDKLKRKHAKLQVNMDCQHSLLSKTYSGDSDVDERFYEGIDAISRPGESFDAYESSLEVNPDDRNQGGDDFSDINPTDTKKEMVLVNKKHTATQCPNEKCMVVYVMTKDYKVVTEKWTQCDEYEEKNSSNSVHVGGDSGIDTCVDTVVHDEDSYNRSTSAEGIDDDNISSVTSAHDIRVPLLPGIPMESINIIPKSKEFLQNRPYSCSIIDDDVYAENELQPLQCYCKEIITQQTHLKSNNLLIRSTVPVCKVCRLKEVFDKYSIGEDAGLTSMTNTAVHEKGSEREKELIICAKEGAICNDWNKVERSLKQLIDFGMNWDNAKLHGQNGENILQMAILNDSRTVAVNLTEFSDEDTLRRVMYDGITERPNTPPNSLYMAVHMGATEIAKKILHKLELSDRIQLTSRPMPPMKFTRHQNKSIEEEFSSKYCLFRAAENGQVDLFVLLVDQGAPLDLIEKNQSILHKLISLTSTSRSDEWNGMLVSMMKHVIESSGKWWQSDPRMADLARTSDGQDVNKDALEYLLSLQNKNNENVLTYVARRGSPEMLEVVINTPVYCVKSIPSITGAFGYNAYKTNDVDTTLKHDGSAIIDIIIKRSPSTASRMLEIEPFHSMIKDKWNRFHLFHVFWFLGYVLYMVILSLVALNRPLNAASLSDMYQTPADYGRLVGEITVTLSVPIFFVGEVIDAKNDRWTLPYPRQGDGLYRIIAFLFSVGIIVWLGLRFAVDPNEDVVLSLCLFLGWFYCMKFMLAYKWTGFFPIMIQRVLLKDIVRFSIVLILLLVAFVTSMYSAFLATPSVSDYDSFSSSLYSLFKLAVGLQDTESITQSRNRGTSIFLFVLFIILFNILLLNLLIAMMSDTYARTRDSVALSWPWMRANTALVLERRMCPCASLKYYPDDVAMKYGPHQRQFRYRKRKYDKMEMNGDPVVFNKITVEDHFVLVHIRSVQAEEKNRDLRSMTYRTAGSILW